MKKRWRFYADRLFSWLLYFFMFTLNLTYRRRELHKERLHKTEVSGKMPAFIYVFWHETTIPYVLTQSSPRLAGLYAYSFLGKQIGYLCDRLLKIEPVWGSQKKGGKAAREGLLLKLKEGCSVALGIDGSKGPRRKAKPGAVSLAKHSGCSIVPCYGFSDRSWRSNSI